MGLVNPHEIGYSTRNWKHYTVMHSAMNEPRLRKAVSDIVSEIDRYKALEDLSSIDEVTQAEYGYAGLCCEAVKENLVRTPKTAMEEAVSSHRDFCQKFNTNRLNPKLSLTSVMRNIAKRSYENRNANNLSNSKLARSTSCVPRIDLN
ncbi:hypothetical protein Pint_12858 [Pistacia integerrima]|uniref:Uncharacterized protein n=1 Tax=Pistacia integerrima TaxID=434235 RepID=A0ACC0YAE0_9ROSI|nr:hypothetical protein Pint_12858 [Pistacia integerrima]